MRIVTRVGLLVLVLRNLRAGSNLCSILLSCAGLCVTSPLNDKAFFVAAKARDTQWKALMFVAFAGVPFLDVTVSFIASGAIPHRPCAHLAQSADHGK